MSEFWKDRSIDIFKDGFKEDLYYTMKDNNVGGPSIIFNRYYEKDKTRIRDAEMTRTNIEPKPCKKVVGYDTNALYLWAIMQDMPTGQYTRRLESDGFKKQWSGKVTVEWLIQIRHQYNNTEKRIGAHRLPVDGFCSETQTVYQFHGMLMC